MGNDHSTNPSFKSKVSDSIKRRKSLKEQKLKLKHEKFFMAHHKSQQERNSISPNSSNNSLQPYNIRLQKRVIFVSLMGLYQSWKSCPSTILYSSIFLLPLQKQWIYQKKHCYQHDFGFVLQDNDFIKLLKWKDAQGLVFWAKDKIPITEFQKTMELSVANTAQNISPLVVPFWRYLSVKLSQIYDPIMGKNFAPLILNNTWWNNTYSGDISYLDIKKELCFLTMKFKTISEILQQSNPSLNIVTVYHDTNDGSFSIPLDQNIPNIINENDNEEDENDSNEFVVDANITPAPEDENDSMDNVWWVSTEYDDNDNDQNQIA
eukprot:405523_1